MIKASLGFVFTADFSQVLLIEKNRPAWQAGTINGLGGKRQGIENGFECIAREVFEEAGIISQPIDWQPVSHIIWAEWQVEIFALVWNGESSAARSKTDEQVGWYPVHHLPTNVRPNLHWLIPLAIDVLTNENPPRVSIRYAD